MPRQLRLTQLITVAVERRSQPNQNMFLLLELLVSYCMYHWRAGNHLLSPPYPGVDCINMDHRDPRINAYLPKSLVSTVLILQAWYFVLDGRACPSRPIPNIVALDAKLSLWERFEVKPWSRDQAEPLDKMQPWGPYLPMDHTKDARSRSFCRGTER